MQLADARDSCVKTIKTYTRGLKKIQDQQAVYFSGTVYKKVFRLNKKKTRMSKNKKRNKIISENLAFNVESSAPGVCKDMLKTIVESSMETHSAEMVCAVQKSLNSETQKANRTPEDLEQNKPLNVNPKLGFSPMITKARPNRT